MDRLARGKVSSVSQGSRLVVIHVRRATGSHDHSRIVLLADVDLGLAEGSSANGEWKRCCDRTHPNDFESHGQAQTASNDKAFALLDDNLYATLFRLPSPSGFKLDVTSINPDASLPKTVTLGLPSLTEGAAFHVNDFHSQRSVIVNTALDTPSSSKAATS